MSVAVYPGSFDPITNGHLDIVERAASVFDSVIVAVLANPKKAPLLTVEERIEVIRAALAAHDVPDERVDVDSFDGLTVEFARARDATARSSAACGRSATSRPRCSSPTTTGSWRRASTPSSS